MYPHVFSILYIVYVPGVKGIPKVSPLVLLWIVLVALCHIDVAVTEEGASI